MRFHPLAAAFLLLLASCVGATEDVLPVAPNIKGASFVREAEVIVRQGAASSVPVLDEKAKAGNAAPSDYASLPFAEMLSRTIRDITFASGLSSGRPLKLIVEVDSRKAPATGAAFFGADDELAGSVFIRDAETGTELGQLYIKVGRVNGGMMSVVTRGGIREQLAETFARRIATALEPDRSRRKRVALPPKA